MARLMEMVSGGARIPDRWQPQSAWSCSMLRCRAYTCPMLTEMPADGRTEHLRALYNDDGRGCHILCSQSTQLPELKICSDTIVLCQQQWIAPARTQETCSCEWKKSPTSVFKLGTNCASKVRRDLTNRHPHQEKQCSSSRAKKEAEAASSSELIPCCGVISLYSMY